MPRVSRSENKYAPGYSSNSSNSIDWRKEKNESFILLMSRLTLRNLFGPGNNSSSSRSSGTTNHDRLTELVAINIYLAPRAKLTRDKVGG
jgi:hypothetical protein